MFVLGLTSVDCILDQMKDNQPGTYAAVTFDTHTNKEIHNYTTATSLPNAVRLDQLHTTLLYSRKHLPDYKPHGIMMAMYGTPVGLEVWPSKGSERCLLLKYDCPELCARHAYLMSTHNATYDFHDYVPHVTLSYDIGKLDISALPDVREYVKAIVIVNEYSRELILDWASTILINKS